MFEFDLEGIREVTKTIVNLYLYGQETTPNDLSDASLIRDELPDENSAAGTITFNEEQTLDYIQDLLLKKMELEQNKKIAIENQ